MTGYCHSCKHPSHAGHDCPECGCVRYRDRRVLREARQRTWIVTVAFFVRNRWIEREVRVKAMGHAGAAMRAVRQPRLLPASTHGASPRHSRSC